MAPPAFEVPSLKKLSDHRISSADVSTDGGSSHSYSDGENEVTKVEMVHKMDRSRYAKSQPNNALQALRARGDGVLAVVDGQKKAPRRGLGGRGNVLKATPASNATAPGAQAMAPPGTWSRSPEPQLPPGTWQRKGIDAEPMKVNLPAYADVALAFSAMHPEVPAKKKERFAHEMPENFGLDAASSKMAAQMPMKAELLFTAITPPKKKSWSKIDH